MLVVKAGPLPTETSPVSSQIVIRRQKGGPKCNPDTLLRQRLTLYGVSVLVPNILEDKFIRYLVQNGMGLESAYRAVRISDLIPPFTLAYCVEKVFKSGGPGPQTCDGFLNCLQSYLEETRRLVVPQAGPLGAEPVKTEIRPGTAPPQKWLEWIEAVARLVPHLPPPETPLVRADGLPGPPDEWLEWITTVAPLVPEIPLPEAMPGAEPLPGAEPPAQPVVTEIIPAPVVTEIIPAPVVTEIIPAPVVTEIIPAPVVTEIIPAIRPGPPPEAIAGARTGVGLVAVVGGLLAAIFLIGSLRGGP